MKAVVIRGTGVIGSKVVAKLNPHGAEAIAASPETGVNTLTPVSAEPSVPLEKIAKTRAVRNARRVGTSEPNEDLAARFAREAEPLFDVLMRGARRLTHNDADAEDLLQDALLHAYAGFNMFQEGSNLKAWLFRILYNRWVSAYRTKQRRPSEVPVDGITERDLVESTARAPAGLRSAEAEVLEALPDNEIKAAMAALPDGFRAVLYYADVQGYTYAETAAILGIPHGTVMSRASRGRHRLRIALAHLAHSGGDSASDEPLVA
jgi:RNA polymerase sigma factor (sigma-70 family)